jgi:hypothetical protein
MEKVTKHHELDSKIAESTECSACSKDHFVVLVIVLVVVLLLPR